MIFALFLCFVALGGREVSYARTLDFVQDDESSLSLGPICLTSQESDGTYVYRCWSTWAESQDQSVLPRTVTRLKLDPHATYDPIFGTCTHWVQALSVVPGPAHPIIGAIESKEQAHARLIKEELVHLLATGEPKCFPGATSSVANGRAPLETERKKASAEIRKIQRAVARDPSRHSGTLRALMNSTLAPLETEEDANRCSLDLCMAIDRSGSMADDVHFVGEKVETLKKFWQERYPCGVRVWGFQFGQFESKEYEEDRRLDAVTDLRKVSSYLNDFKADGGGIEPLNDAIASCLRALPDRATAQRAIVVFSDENGDLVPCSPAMSDLLAEAKKRGIGVNLIDLEKPGFAVEPIWLSAALSSDGTLAAAGTLTGEIAIWDANTRQKLQTLGARSAGGNTGDVRKLRFSPDSQRVFALTGDGFIRVWDLKAGALAKTFLAGDGKLNNADMALSPDGRTLATVEWGNPPVLWDVETGTKIRTLAHPAYHLDDSIFSPDGKTVWFNADSGHAALWDIRSGKKLKTLSVGWGVSEPNFSDDGRLIFIRDSLKFKVLDAATYQPVHSFELPPESRFSEIVINPDGKSVAVHETEDVISIFGTTRGERLGEVRLEERKLSSMSRVIHHSADGRRMILLTIGGPPKVVDAATRIPEFSLESKGENLVCHESFDPVTSEHSVLGPCQTLRIHPLSTARRDCRGKFIQADGNQKYLEGSGALIPDPSPKSENSL